METDTDTLIALVSSIVECNVTQPEILEALTRVNGDVQAAAEALESGHSRRKRTRGTLTEWLSPSPNKKKSKIEPGTNSQASSSKVTQAPTVNAFSLLRDNTIHTKPRAQPLPPLTLATPELISKHTPCTLHCSILPPELATTLFHEMVNASRDWSRNKWFLFDRLVESPHRTTFFARGDNIDRSEEARYWYNGRQTDPPNPFSPAMETACEIVERTVNAEIRKRKRYPLEWAGDSLLSEDQEPMIWRANVAAANCYEGSKESVGAHSDQLTYLGPYPTIASISLGVARQFRLRETIPKSEKDARAARTFNIPLPHNSLVIMHAPCQETFKHSVPPQPTIDAFHPLFPSANKQLPTSVCRINITFRFYRPDFSSKSIPRCKCGIPCILRPDMKNRGRHSSGKGDEPDRYWWSCYAGAQNDGKGCGLWQVLDMKKEGRGPVVGPLV